MPNAPAQSYANHVRKVPLGYWATCLAILFGAIGLGWTVFRQPSVATVSALLVALGAGGAAWYARINALLAQDRVIRHEERTRLERILPADLKARIEELSVAQIVSLRFASDGEVAELMRQVLAEGLHDRKAIKQRIRDWRADWMRV
jgi:hypothetical protein